MHTKNKRTIKVRLAPDLPQICARKTAPWPMAWIAACTVQPPAPPRLELLPWAEVIDLIARLSSSSFSSLTSMSMHHAPPLPSHPPFIAAAACSSSRSPRDLPRARRTWYIRVRAGARARARVEVGVGVAVRASARVRVRVRVGVGVGVRIEVELVAQHTHGLVESLGYHLVRVRVRVRAREKVGFKGRVRARARARARVN